MTRMISISSFLSYGSFPHPHLPLLTPHPFIFIFIFVNFFKYTWNMEIANSGGKRGHWNKRMVNRKKP